MVIGLPLRKDQIEDELTEIKERIKALSERGERVPDESSSPGIVDYTKLVEERERTNKLLVGLIDKVAQLERKINSEYEVSAGQSQAANGGRIEEIRLSSVDAKIVNFIETSEREMVCADQIKELMHYRGRNAACARLNAMCKAGLLRKDQLGHKVYYRFDAGKATKALIISPPQ
jgi:superfamily II RNA helicase